MRLKERNAARIMNTMSAVAEVCSWVPGLSSYALAWRAGSLMCQGIKPIGVGSKLKNVAFLALSAWQAGYVSNWWLKSLQK